MAVAFSLSNCKVLDGASDAASECSWSTTSDNDWGNKLIVQAYEMIGEEMAETKARKKAAEEKAKKKEAGEKAKKKEAAVLKKKFPVGSFCQAVYSGDGCYYEGKVIFLKDFTCVVEFVGYKNQEEVDLKTLKPSKGKKTRKNQMKVANETYAMNVTYAAEGQGANFVPTPQFPTNAGAANESAANASAGAAPNMPETYYAPPEIPNLACAHVPPEPPMPPCSVMNDPGLSAMLMSWYMAGYYTGVNGIQNGTSCAANPRCHGHPN